MDKLDRRTKVMGEDGKGQQVTQLLSGRSPDPPHLRVFFSLFGHPAFVHFRAFQKERRKHVFQRVCALSLRDKGAIRGQKQQESPEERRQRLREQANVLSRARAGGAVKVSEYEHRLHAPA